MLTWIALKFIVFQPSHFCHKRTPRYYQHFLLPFRVWTVWSPTDLTHLTYVPTSVWPFEEAVLKMLSRGDFTYLACTKGAPTKYVVFYSACFHKSWIAQKDMLWPLTQSFPLGTRCLVFLDRNLGISWRHAATGSPCHCCSLSTLEEMFSSELFYLLLYSESKLQRWLLARGGGGGIDKQGKGREEYWGAVGEKEWDTREKGESEVGKVARLVGGSYQAPILYLCVCVGQCLGKIRRSWK